jgi:hypothetical protein
LNRFLSIMVTTIHNLNTGWFTFLEFLSESEMLHLGGIPYMFVSFCFHKVLYSFLEIHFLPHVKFNFWTLILVKNPMNRQRRVSMGQGKRLNCIDPWRRVGSGQSIQSLTKGGNAQFLRSHSLWICFSRTAVTNENKSNSKNQPDFDSQ